MGAPHLHVVGDSPWAPAIAAFQAALAEARAIAVVGAAPDPQAVPPEPGKESTWVERATDRLKRLRKRAQDAITSGAEAAKAAGARVVEKVKTAAGAVKDAVQATGAKVKKTVLEELQALAAGTVLGVGGLSIVTLALLYFFFKGKKELGL
jgi:hypothetical protein